MRACCSCGTLFNETGKGYRCPPCRKDYDRAWRIRRRAEGKPSSGAKMPREYHREYEKGYGARPEVKALRCEKARTSRNNPLERFKHVARWKLNRAVASGRIVRLPCQICGAAKSQGHHHDYTLPLDVIWLCPVHHTAEHAKAEGKTQ